MRYKTLLIAFIALLISGCASISPSTITGAIQGHAQFPSLSQSVAECVSEYPAERVQIVDPFNTLVDKWSAASELQPDATLLVALAGAQNDVREAKLAWLEIKSVIVDARIDCGPAVVSMVKNIETTFVEIEAAIVSNERAVYVLEWANLIGSVVLGRRGEVVRL